MLHAQSIRVAYGSHVALDDASLSVGEGEIVAVVGRSGSGKSTLLQCLAGIIRPSAGIVSFKGSRVDDATDARLSDLRRTEFGFVFQFGELVPELELVENVSLPLRFAGIPRRQSRQRAEAMLGELGIGELAGRLPGQVSGGQAQRAAVARALVHNPAVVFADEPTGALDTHSGDIVLTSLHAMARRQGTAVVVVTHDPRVAEHADRIVQVNDGRVLASGATA